MTLEGAKVRKPEAQQIAVPDLPAPALPAIDGTHNIVITGVGGTGVVTVGALLAMAARREGEGAGVMEMAGLAQKGGAVHIHCRIAETPQDITAVRVAVGEAHALIGGDMVVAAGAKTLGLLARGRTRAVLNTHQIITGAFTRDTEFTLPTDRLSVALRARIGDEALSALDATELATHALGDAIYANVLMLGAAWQAGLVPLSAEAILKAIEINGAGVAGNTQAFALGRWAVVDPEAVRPLLGHSADPLPQTLDEVIATRRAHLTDYQSKRLANRYEKRVRAASGLDAGFAMAVAKGYHKLLSYKDEYEVARLHAQTLQGAVDAAFTDVKSMRFHLAPPLLAKKDARGVPIKKEYGAGMMRIFGLLARLKGLRGTPLDVFGYTAERKMERALIREYERDLAAIMKSWNDATADVSTALAELPLQIRGFGHVKQSNALAAAKRREELLAARAAGAGGHKQAAE